jgi:cell division protein FtsB
MAKKKTASKTRVVKIVPVVERIEAKRAEIAGLSADRNMVSAKIKQASDELAALNVEERGV